ncbi:MAG: hypothetical protein PHW74_04795 [Desulfobacca sp.]|nr:hypothetical protein [Desulfobacca sp.]
MPRCGRGLRNLSSLKIWLILGAVLVWLSGCTYPSAVEQNYGRAVTVNKVNQLVNPEAGLHQASASVGLPPQVGVKVNAQYTDSFQKKEEEHKPIFLFQEQ